MSNSSIPKLFDKPHLQYGFWLMVVVFMVFARSLWGELVYWDDGPYIFENPTVLMGLTWENIHHIFFQAIHMVFTPLSTLSCALEYSLFGLNSFMFHLDNLLLHLGVVWLAWQLARRMGLAEQAAFIGVLIFAIHPMRVESVVWATERKDVLYALLYLLAIHKYLDYWQQNKRISYYAALAAGFLSMLAKPMALSLPLVLLLLDWFFKRPVGWRSVLDKLPIFCYVVLLGLFTYLFHVRNPVDHPGQSLLIWLWSTAFYIKKFFWPLVLCPLYSLPKPVSWQHWPYLQSMGIVWGAVILLVMLRRLRYFVFAFWFYVLSIFFIWRFDTAKDINIVADRFMYLPSLGFSFFLGWVLASGLDWVKLRKADWQWLAKGMVITFIATLAFLTIKQIGIWRNSQMLWDSTVACCIDSDVAHNNLASLALKRGNMDLAHSHYNLALLLNRNNENVYYNRAVYYELVGKSYLAMEDLNRVIALKPYYTDAYQLRSIIYNRSGYYHLAWVNAIAAVETGSYFSKEYFDKLKQKLKEPK